MNKLIFVPLCLLLISCVATKPYKSTQSSSMGKVSIVKDSEYTELRVTIFELDKNCQFEYAGTVSLEKDETLKVVSVPAGRFYFRVTGFFKYPGASGNTGVKDKSFIIENNKEYIIYFQNLGDGGFRKVSYRLNYLEKGSEGQPSKSIVTKDNFLAIEEHSDCG